MIIYNLNDNSLKCQFKDSKRATSSFELLHKLNVEKENDKSFALQLYIYIYACVQIRSDPYRQLDLALVVERPGIGRHDKRQVGPNHSDPQEKRPTCASHRDLNSHHTILQYS